MIGFKIKVSFNGKYNNEEFYRFFEKYRKVFSIIQIKIKHDYANQNNLPQILYNLNQIFGHKFYIHLNSKRITEDKARQELELLASTIGDFGNFVVHLDDNFSDSDLFDAARILKNNQILFFENNKNEYYLKNYWNKLDRFFKMNKFSNIKFCLDLGHLFFKKPVKLQKEICNKLLTYPDFMENIALIHPPP